MVDAFLIYDIVFSDDSDESDEDEFLEEEFLEEEFLVRNEEGEGDVATSTSSSSVAEGGCSFSIVMRESL